MFMASHQVSSPAKRNLGYRRILYPAMGSPVLTLAAMRGVNITDIFCQNSTRAVAFSTGQAG